MDQKESLAQQAIESVHNGQMAFCKFLSANDTGLTGGHQCGIYVPKPAYNILFDEKGVKGENKERFAKIHWFGDYETESKFTYYGTNTRDEYRITRFGRGFDLLKEENTGALVVIVKLAAEDYEGWVLETEDDIDEFLDYFSLSPADTGRLIGAGLIPADEKEQQKLARMDAFIHALKGSFPKAADMSAAARDIYNEVYNHLENIVKKPDKELLGWTNTEYDLFRRIEEIQYGDVIRGGFTSMQDFIDTANSVINRRKSRAGKSLEYHLEAIFQGNNLPYAPQVVTEERKRPDFVFPGKNAYHNPEYPSEKLVVLGAKTTCKDRWRQVITEAARVKTKYLCTLQQGISPQQLHEMESENVVLVVPKDYKKTYPMEYREGILTLADFIELVKEKTAD